MPAEAVELVHLTGVRLVVQERDETGMVRHERFDRGLNHRTRDPGIRCVAACLQY